MKQVELFNAEMKKPFLILSPDVSKVRFKF